MKTIKVFVVEVISYKTGDVVKSIECYSERAADRVDRVLNNINSEEFFTRIVDKEKEISES